jgi:hypothetical protein
MATDYKGSWDVHVTPGRNPNGVDKIHDPKAKKRQLRTKTDSGCQIILTIPIDSG